MGAQFLCVPWDSEEVRQIAPPATEVVLEVECRAEDISFAKDLAALLLKHIMAMVDACPGCCSNPATC